MKCVLLESIQMYTRGYQTYLSQFQLGYLSGFPFFFFSTKFLSPQKP